MKILLKIEGILCMLFVALFIFSFEKPNMAFATIISALIHEIGHILALYFLGGIEFSLPKGRLDGFRIYTRKMLSYKEELIVLLAGPTANFVIFLLFIFWQNEFAFLMAGVNLLTMLSNLMPISRYDGYKALECIFSMKSKDISTYQDTLLKISFAFSVVLTFFSLYLILKLGTGYFIFGIFICNLLKTISKRSW